MIQVREDIPSVQETTFFTGWVGLLSCNPTHDHSRYLGLVSDGAHAAVVYESEHALTVVARDELCWHADVIDVRVTGATSHLKDKRAFFSIF